MSSGDLALRNLHSSPTRRSSDLPDFHGQVDACADELATFAARARELDIRLSSHPGQYRSEEHTSELQSRRELVCRLLLEKKKRQHARANVSRLSTVICTQAFRRP